MTFSKDEENAICRELERTIYNLVTGEKKYCSDQIAKICANVLKGIVKKSVLIRDISDNSFSLVL